MINEFAGRDVFDSRDIQERIDELEPTADSLLALTERIEDMAADPEHDPDSLRELEDDKAQIDMDEIDEYNELLEFKNDAGTSEWSYGVTFIEDSYFEEYAQELAEDIGAIPRGVSWPCTCIDWEQATRELKMDYSVVEFGEYTYYYRD